MGVRVKLERRLSSAIVFSLFVGIDPHHSVRYTHSTRKWDLIS